MSLMQLKHPAPNGVTVYYWPTSLILLAPSLLLDRPTSPLCATLRIACGKPYVIEVNGQQITTRASLVAPGAIRNKLIALDSDIALFYIPLDAPSMHKVKELLGSQELLNFSIEKFEHLLPNIRKAATDTVSPAEAGYLMDDVIEAMIGEKIKERAPIDLRVKQLLNVLASTPFNEVSVEVLCEQVHLSPSRLRHLFKKEVGFTIQQYARWLVVWRACLLWQRGRQFTDLALEAGFHDLSHFDHAFNEVFGVNPTNVIDPAFVRLINCAPETSL